MGGEGPYCHRLCLGHWRRHVQNRPVWRTANTWTNLAQPFWIITMLGICGLKAKDIMGYAIAILLLSGPIYMLGVIFLTV